LEIMGIFDTKHLVPKIHLLILQVVRGFLENQFLRVSQTVQRQLKMVTGDN